jgi:uncharacterized protein YdeI (YjbR/CyaY-like superfamily)
MRVTHFTTTAAFRGWLEKHHATATELWVGFYNKESRRGGMSYQQSVEEALCFGWIDGIRKKVNAASYTNRFTPRKTGSTWSKVNVGHVKRLQAAGRMRAPGLAAFAARSAAKTGIYSFEQRPQKFPAVLEGLFRMKKRAWKYWSAQPPGYQRTAIWWVISAKQDATRRRRLDRLIADSAAGRRLGAA